LFEIEKSLANTTLPDSSGKPPSGAGYHSLESGILTR
jgi:hypothetical protein